MSATVVLGAFSFEYPQGGGHRWVYLNWALGLKSLGCRVIWLEVLQAGQRREEIDVRLEALNEHLRPFGFDGVCLWERPLDGIDPAVRNSGFEGCLALEETLDADLFLNFRYGTPSAVVNRFRRSALVDIDPGLLQLWMHLGKIEVPRHDLYFTTGETVGRPEARFPDGGVHWHNVRPCVAVDAWPVTPPGADAAFSTVSHWTMGEWMTDGDEVYSNDKRTGFLPYLDIPARTSVPLELALCLAADEESERSMLEQRGWRVKDAWTVATSPASYQRYLGQSLGEFSCVKPSCVRLENAWISDRTLCYLASGKPAVVQWTGRSRLLPDGEGLLRFATPGEAIEALEEAAGAYDFHSGAARKLAEEHFDAKRVLYDVLESALA